MPEPKPSHLAHFMLLGLFQTPNLPLTLVNLQPQLSPNDDIYVICYDRSGIDAVRRCGASRSVICAEVVRDASPAPLAIFKQFAEANKHQGVLVVKDMLVSQTFVSNLKRVIKEDYDIFTPVVLESGSRLNPNFNWFNPVSQSVSETAGYCPNCFYTKFGGNRIALMENEFVTNI